MQSNDTDVTVKDLELTTEDYAFRSPIKFGGVELDRVTILNVHCRVKTLSGKESAGFGSMPLGNIWSFPSKTMGYEQTLKAMRVLADRIRKITADYQEPGHPIDVNHALEPLYLKAAEEVSRELGLTEPIPKLCTLVTASPFDAAIHDGFGKVHGRSSWSTYGPDLLKHDIGHYLDARFAGETLDRYVQQKPKPRMPNYHLIGAVDPITAADVKKPLRDGLPETLPEWIRADGLTHLKIKLNGDNLDLDVERVVTIERAAAATQKELGVDQWYYSLDFNEKCPNVAYLVEFLHKVEERAPAAFARTQYIEQPTKRDLKNDRGNVMHEAAKIRPVVIDESLTDLETLEIAREMGYSGAALKACKGQSQAVLMGAAIQKFGMFLCVQDLSCPGASLIHSASIAAHIPTVAAIEANSRQYCPAANEKWAPRFPGIFKITGGTMNTAILDGPGLGAVA